MAKTKNNPLGYQMMPKEDGLRCGCKVSWKYYRDKAVAEKAGKVAEHNARIDASQGYDFGYCCPGSVTLVKGYKGEYAQFNGMYEVCTS